MRDSFIFYKDWLNAISDLPKEVQLEVYQAIAEYAIKDILIELKPLAKVAFSFIKQTVDRDIDKYLLIKDVRSEAGKKGATSKWQMIAKDNKNNKCHDNVNVNDNVNDLKENTKRKTFIIPEISEVENYFKINDYSKQHAQKFYEYYNTSDWKDSEGKQVKNWKQKAIAVWFKNEGKIENSKQEQKSREKVAIL